MTVAVMVSREITVRSIVRTDTRLELSDEDHPIFVATAIAVEAATMTAAIL